MTGPVHEDVFHEPDNLPRGLLLRIAVGTLAVGLGLCAIAYLLLRARESSLFGSRPIAGERLPAPHRVAEVREEVFSITRPKPTLLEERRQMLERYGWVDRPRGVISVPIEVGMDMVVREAQAGRIRP